MPLPTMTEAMIRLNTSETSFQRGRDYFEQHAVTSLVLVLRGTLLIGEVAGSSGDLYRVRSVLLAPQVAAAVSARDGSPAVVKQSTIDPAAIRRQVTSILRSQPLPGEQKANRGYYPERKIRLLSRGGELAQVRARCRPEPRKRWKVARVS